MAKEVLLISTVEGIGTEGEVVRVADGFARNYLLPRKLAAPVNKGTRRLVEKKKEERATRLAAEEESYRKLAEKLADLSVTISVKTGEGGKLFGSVAAADVLTALKQLGVELERKQLELASPIREIGVYKLPVKLHAGVEASLEVRIVEE